MAEMITNPTEYPHIVRWENGVPVIRGTRFKLPVFIKIAHGQEWDAAAMHENYPDLTLAQIHSAFAFYYDHQAEIDADIERREAYAEEQYQAWLRSDFAAYLRARSSLV